MLKRCAILLVFGSLQFVSVLSPVVLYAADLSAPIVRLSLDLESHEEGMPIFVSAMVMDDHRVKQVVLRFRLSGESDEFLSVPMEKNIGSPLYSASIPAAKVMPPGVEYFVEATDAEGNISQQPYPSHPHMVIIEGERSTTASRKINWWWVLAGAVAVGAVAGADSGSDPPDTAVNGESSEGLTVVAPVP